MKRDNSCQFRRIVALLLWPQRSIVRLYDYIDSPIIKIIIERKGNLINANLHNVLIVYTYQKKIEKWIETFIDLRAKKKAFPFLQRIGGIRAKGRPFRTNNKIGNKFSIFNRGICKNSRATIFWIIRDK